MLIIPFLSMHYINCAQCWPYLQDYTGMRGQQNIKFCSSQFQLHVINGNTCVFRYFSTGQQFPSLAFSFRMGHHTVVKIMDQDSDILWSKLSSKHLAVSDCDRFLDIVVKFQETRNFPVIGCIDGKRIHIKYPTKAGSLFYNYKHFFSLQYYKSSQILKAGSFLQTQVLMVSKVMVVHFLLLLGIASWKTLNVPLTF